MGQVLIQVWLKSIKMSELFDKQVNAQKEKNSGVHASSRKPTKKCAMKMKESRRKNDGCLKYF